LDVGDNQHCWLHREGSCLTEEVEIEKAKGISLHQLLSKDIYIYIYSIQLYSKKGRDSLKHFDASEGGACTFKKLSYK